MSTSTRFSTDPLNCLTACRKVNPESGPAYKWATIPFLLHLLRECYSPANKTTVQVPPPTCPEHEQEEMPGPHAAAPVASSKKPQHETRRSPLECQLSCLQSPLSIPRPWFWPNEGILPSSELGCRPSLHGQAPWTHSSTESDSSRCPSTVPLARSAQVPEMVKSLIHQVPSPTSLHVHQLTQCQPRDTVELLLHLSVAEEHGLQPLSTSPTSAPGARRFILNVFMVFNCCWNLSTTSRLSSSWLPPPEELVWDEEELDNDLNILFASSSKSFTALSELAWLATSRSFTLEALPFSSPSALAILGLVGLVSEDGPLDLEHDDAKCLVLPQI